jgi:Flp pilus assembly protein CpaB
MENLMPRGMLGSSRRTLVAGIGALILAIILLLVYLNHYRNSVNSANASVAVVSAKVFIPKGTAALSLARNGSFEVTPVPRKELKDGAVTDAAVLHDQVALDDIYPGQQITTADFGVTATSSALSGSADLLGTGKTAGTYRALAITLDSAHGLSPQVTTGDHVDVYYQQGGAIGLLMQNVPILQAPNQGAAGSTAPTSGNYVLRLPSRMVPRFAFAAGNGTIWFALRPQRGAKPASSGQANNNNVLQK